MKVKVVIPFRDRNIDPLRRKNMDFVLASWSRRGYDVSEVSDGRAGDEQFNRSAAYNRGFEQTDADVIVYTESDMLLSSMQIDEGIALAAEEPGLVVPFTEYRYLGERDSESIRLGYITDEHTVVPESVMTGGSSIGAVNIVSREAMNSVGGWDEGFEGNWYDDDAMKIAFELTCGPTRWVEGSAYHLYHLPGWTGQHLSERDRLATENNRLRLELYKQAETSEDILNLTGFGKR